MRLCLVTPHYPPEIGGIQSYSEALAQRFAAKFPGFFVATVPARAPAAAGPSAAEVIRLGSAVDSLAFSSVWTLAHLCRQRQIDVALACHWSAAASLALCRRYTGYPRRIVTAVHGKELVHRPLAVVPPAQWLHDALRRRALAASDRLLPVSQCIAGKLRQRGLPNERLHVVNNGVDSALFAPGDSAAAKQRLGMHRRRVLLTVSRLVERKGIDRCLQAVASLRQRLPDLLYVVVGDGPDRQRLQAIAAGLGLDRHVRFVGSVLHEQTVPYFQACDAFVLCVREKPGDFEGFGLVYLEAGACGKAVIGCDSGGVADAVRHLDNGLLLQDDTPQSIAAAAATLLQSDTALAHRLGASGLAYARQHAGWDAVATRIAQHCQAVLSPRMANTDR